MSTSVKSAAARYIEMNHAAAVPRGFAEVMRTLAGAIDGGLYMKTVIPFFRGGTLAACALTVMAALPMVANAQATTPKPEDVKAGGQKAQQCFSCHGADGVAKVPGAANLAGQPADYLAKAMKDYKTGVRKNEIMGPLASGLSDSDMAQIAAYYSHINVTVTPPKK